MRKPNNYWNKENCINEAMKYASRIEFEKKNRSACVISRRNGWIEECCQHMDRLGSKYKRLIYVFEFSDKSVYIGLTYNSKQRLLSHLSDTKSQVYKYISAANIQPIFKEITEYIDVDEASKKEIELIQNYKNEGWNVLNVIRGGGIGGDKLIWTKEKCKNEAQKFLHRSEFKKLSGGAFNAAKRHDWLNEITMHMKKPPVWNKGKIFKTY